MQKSASTTLAPRSYRAVVGGVSMGTGVALRMALAYPDAVAGLVVVHPVHRGTDLGLGEGTRAALHAMDAVGGRAPSEGLEVLHPLFDPLPEPIRTRARAMVASFDPHSVATTTRFLASGGRSARVR